MAKLTFSLILSMLSLVVTAQNDYYGYLYCHMSRSGEYTAFALSRDGIHFHDLIDGKPVYNVEEHSRIEGGARDAYICRAGDGSGFVMTTTDMCVRKSKVWFNYGIDLLKSADLIHWSSVTFDFRQGPGIFCDPESPDVYKDYGGICRVWAPQAIWDADYVWPDGTKGGYMVYYSMLHKTEDKYDRIFYSYADRSFTKLTKPRLLIDWGYATIDTDINYVAADGKYHAMIKKEGGQPGIFTTTSTKLTGPYSLPDETDYVNFEGNRKCEGASAFQPIGEDTWRVAYVEYSSRPARYRICKADKYLRNFHSPEDIQGVAHPQHGSFIKLTKTEYERLQEWSDAQSSRTLLMGAYAVHAQSGISVFSKGQSVELYVGKTEKPAVNSAVQMLAGDVRNVFDAEMVVKNKIGKSTRIIAGTISHSEIKKFAAQNNIVLSDIEGKWEAFKLQVIGERLIILGSDARGVAYGLLELSRLIGVSPWEWWADVTPNKMENLVLAKDYTDVQMPSVQYRGIFINDEDWGINPWSTKTYEPESQTLFPITGRFKGQLGPKTYSRVFELLLRLRANTLWPAMHEVTMPFFFVKGNKEMADRYGIILGTAHCEPMMRNSATEWDLVGKGDYNYFTNRDNVYAYWEDRVKLLQHSENIFTIGMRGKHDGRMEGAKDVQKYKEGLNMVIPDQTKLLRRYINESVEKIPQAFIPYKEVLEVYQAGLSVPDYVTLIWPDDNFGYIRHFPNASEQKRSGGNGVYYHTSYWGEPHDFLWLGIVSPDLMLQQMGLAYEKGARKMWILNVGDIKPSEYLTELFLDIAWNVNEVRHVATHLQEWLVREFGLHIGNRLLPVMQTHYHLAHIRRPEFLSNTKLYTREQQKVNDLPWNESEIKYRLAAYKQLSDSVEVMAGQIAPDRADAFFELIKYPVQAADQINRKALIAQLARHHKADWADSDLAFDSIAHLTQIYNALNHGKWKYMMDFQPRKLPVFLKARREELQTDLPKAIPELCRYAGGDFSLSKGDIRLIPNLGYGNKAVDLSAGSSVSYDIPKCKADSLTLDIRLLPTHVVNSNELRFSVSVDGVVIGTFNYETKEYSEEWKQNILRNQSIRQLRFKNDSAKRFVTIKALDDGVIVDQVLIH